MSGTSTSSMKHLQEPARSPSFAPLLVALALVLLGLLIFFYHTELENPTVETLLSRLLWRNSTVRPPVLLVLIIFGWGLVVRAARKTSLNIDHVLGGRCLPPTHMYHAALTLLLIVLFAHLIHFVASDFPGLTWRPWLTCNLGLHAVLILFGTMPTNTFHAESRHSLLKTLHESIIAPCAPVTFWHVIVADYLTSLAKAFADLQVMGCISMAILSERPNPHKYVTTSTLWEQYNHSCADTYANTIFLALPFWWRLMQCLKVYSVTGEQKNLWNALKYSTAFPLVVAGYLRRHQPSVHHDRLFVLCALVQSSYCYFWDVQMDWGLLVADSRAPFGYRLREPLLVTRQKWVYAVLCVFNFCLRFVWSLSVFGGVSGRGRGMFFFESVEILRRTVWALFRIEWEVVVKVYNSSYASMPLNSVVSCDASDDGRSADETVPITKSDD